MSVRERIAEVIQQSGLKQKAIADRLGEPEYWLSNRLTGRTVIRADELIPIAEAIGVDPCALLRPPGSAIDVGNAVPQVADLGAERLYRRWLRVLEEDEGDAETIIDYLEWRRLRDHERGK